MSFTNTKRMTAALLACLLILPASAGLSSCGTDTSQETQSASTADSATDAQESVAAADRCDLPEDLFFDNAEISFLYADTQGKNDELISDGNSGLISEAVFERNELVRNQLRVKLSFLPSEEDSVATKLENDVASGLGSYDIVVNGTYRAVSPALSGHYQNLSAVDYIDTSKSYWTQGFNDLVTFTPQRKQYLASGAAAISMFRYVFLTLYNRTEMESRKLPDMYETVKNGDWTLDTQLSMIKDLYQDKNSDSKANTGDFFGFVTGSGSSIDPYMVAANIHLVVKDADTQALKFDTDSLKRVSDLQAKVSLLYNDASTYFYRNSTSIEDWAGRTKNIINAFTAKNAMMVTCLFLDMETEIESLTPMSYGIAPLPKFDKAQTRYYSYVQDQVSCFGISAGVKSAERVSMLGAVLESMAWNSGKIIPNAYYNTNLSLKFMQDPQSVEMLDLIFETVQFDFSSTCSNMFSGLVLRDELRPLLCSTTAKVASASRRWDEKMKKILADANEKIAKLP